MKVYCYRGEQSVSCHNFNKIEMVASYSTALSICGLKNEVYYMYSVVV